VQVLPEARTITAFAGSFIRLRDYQTSPSITCPTAHPGTRKKAVEEKSMVGS